MTKRWPRALFFTLLVAVASLLGCPSSPPGGASRGGAEAESGAPPPSSASARPSAAPEPPPSASAAPSGPHGKILCFGDSITQADWPGKIAPEERWVTQLGKKSSAIEAINAGKNGRKTTAIDELEKALDATRDAAIVLFFLGVNNMKKATVGVVEKATSDMGRMIDLTRKKLPKAEIALCAPININLDKLTPYFKDEGLGPDTVHFMKALAAAYETLAKKKGVRFINLLHAVTPEHIEDGVHTNGKGQIQIADAVWSGLVATSAP